MDTLPVHGSWLKFLGGVALAAACCVVVGLIALTFSHHPCLGLNKAGGEGSCAAPVTTSQHRRFPHRPHLSAFGVGVYQEGVECVLRRVFPAFFLTSEERTSRMSPCMPRRKRGSVRPSGAGPHPWLLGREETDAGNDGQRCGHSRHTADSSGEAANYSEPLAAEILAAAGKSTAMVTCGNNVNINGALGRDGGRPLCDGPSCPHGHGLRSGWFSDPQAPRARLHRHACNLYRDGRCYPSWWDPMAVTWGPSSIMRISFNCGGRHAAWSHGLCSPIRWIGSHVVYMAPSGPFLLCGLDISMQPSVLWASALVRQFLLWCWFDNFISTWVFVQVSSTSGDGINNIIRSSIRFFFNGSTDPLFTDSLRGQSIRVHASSTPCVYPSPARLSSTAP